MIWSGWQLKFSDHLNALTKKSLCYSYFLDVHRCNVKTQKPIFCWCHAKSGKLQSCLKPCLNRRHSQDWEKNAERIHKVCIPQDQLWLCFRFVTELWWEAQDIDIWCELWNPVTFSQIYSFDSAFFRSNWNYMQANTTSSGHLREMVGSTYVTLEFDRKEEGGPYPTTSKWLWHRQGILEPLEQIIYQLSKNKHLIASDSSKMKSW